MTIMGAQEMGIQQEYPSASSKNDQEADSSDSNQKS